MPSFSNIIYHRDVAVTYTAMLWIDSHGGLVCGLCYNSISDYVKHSSDLAWKRKRETGKNDEDCTDTAVCVAVVQVRCGQHSFTAVSGDQVQFERTPCCANGVGAILQ